MKKAVITLSVAGLCLAASAHSASDGNRNLGRQSNAVSVPEVVPTIGLVLMSVASLAVLAAYLPGKRGQRV